MSTTQASFEATPQPDPAEAFDEIVFYNPAICSECFQRIKRIETDVVAHGAIGTRERQFTARVGAGVHGHGFVNHDAFNPVVCGRTFCGECGSQSGRAISDTLGRLDATDRAHTLADRLDEEGIPVNESALAYAVYQLKGEERLRGYDREIFARATKLAIRHA